MQSLVCVSVVRMHASQVFSRFDEIMYSTDYSDVMEKTPYLLAKREEKFWEAKSYQTFSLFDMSILSENIV